jgi:hypothetical protein
MSISPDEQVKITVRYQGIINLWELYSSGREIVADGREGFLEEITLRKGFEWDDFSFLMNSRLKYRPWEA